MSDKTGISWTDATWNPVRGCSRVSEGCRNCYAERVAARFSDEGMPYHGLAKRTLLTKYVDGVANNVHAARWTGVVRLVPEHLADPIRWKRPRRIFVNSMSDLFHEQLTNEQIAAVFGVMAAAPQHTFQVLTKRATRMREWFAWVAEQAEADGGAWTTCLRETISALPDERIGNQLVEDGIARDGAVPDREPWPLPNVWLGVSVENQDAADERIPELLATPAAVRFLSCEPLLGSVDLRPKDRGNRLAVSWLEYGCTDERIDWVIVGCESGPGARACNVEWIRSLRDQCASAGVALFVKQAQETNVGTCGDGENPNGDTPCRQRITTHVISTDTAAYSCGCTVEGSELGAGIPIGAGDGSKRKAGGVIELPYLDGVQHTAFP